VIADRFDTATIIFADIVDFTPLVAETEASQLVGMLHDTFSTFDTLAERHGIEKIKTIGDAYMAVAGVPDPRHDHADRALAFSQDIIAAMSDAFGARLKLRIGINSGPVIAGLIGQKRSVYDVWGETVNLAARLESSGEAGQIHMSRTTLDALSSAPTRTVSQFRTLKGIGRLETFTVR
jgi:adenylate cyclase